MRAEASFQALTILLVALGMAERDAARAVTMTPAVIVIMTAALKLGRMVAMAAALVPAARVPAEAVLGD